MHWIYIVYAILYTLYLPCLFARSLSLGVVFCVYIGADECKAKLCFGRSTQQSTQNRQTHNDGDVSDSAMTTPKRRCRRRDIQPVEPSAIRWGWSWSIGRSCRLVDCDWELGVWGNVCCKILRACTNVFWWLCSDTRHKTHQQRQCIHGHDTRVARKVREKKEKKQCGIDRMCEGVFTSSSFRMLVLVCMQ